MITAKLMVDAKMVEIKTYDDLDTAIDQCVEMGWEDDDEQLLASPIFFTDETGVLATITWSPAQDKGERPYLHVHWTRTGTILTYRCRYSADTYYPEVVP